MNFDLSDLMNDGDKNSSENFISQKSFVNSHGEKSVQASSSSESSLVLKELFEEMDQLRNKIKLNQRQMLFLESENNRLLQEKNKFFFENKTMSEKFQLIVEKNDYLSQSFDSLNSKHEFLVQKEQALSSLLKTQSIDLQRMSKFYLKIKNIIKPYVHNLKAKVAELTTNSELQKTTIAGLQTTLAEQIETISTLQSDLENRKKSYQFEKIDLIKNYEEQLHDLAKEIVETKSSESDTRSENLRLKKNLENKFSLENELIKYKRDVTEMTEKIIALESQSTKHNNMITSAQNELSMTKQKMIQAESFSEQKTLTIESLRHQLATKLDEIEKLNLRIKMFEKLNVNLSLAADNHAAENTKTSTL